MKFLVIGSRGQLGTDLLDVLPPDTVGVDYPELDVRQPGAVRALLQRERPGWVINCAAQTHVDRCEQEPVEAFQVNALGALHVAHAAAEVGARVLFISTDYVFGGDLERLAPYTELDRPAPLGVYAASKLAGEQLTLANQPRGLVVRTAGLYGHAGARGKGGNFVETMLRLGAAGQPVRVVHDQRLCPTSSRAFAERLVAVLAADVAGILHVAAPDSCTWYEFARAIFELAGLRVDLQPIPSSAYPTPARRPSFSALTSIRADHYGLAPCPPWRGMLRDYLVERAVALEWSTNPPPCQGGGRGRVRLHRTSRLYPPASRL